MKNLVKALEWDIPWNDRSQHAYTHDFVAMYLVSEYVKHSGEFAATLSIDDNITWKSTGFTTIEAAKAACQQHYAESIWDSLSPETQAILEKHFNHKTPNT